ncbi:hypothetical protein Vi05172_g2546 [Venturia inaequalis]|nr:hypothetical protein Vi05172_g2546 [Venturia inaequalis]
MSNETAPTVQSRLKNVPLSWLLDSHALGNSFKFR